MVPSNGRATCVPSAARRNDGTPDDNAGFGSGVRSHPWLRIPSCFAALDGIVATLTRRWLYSTLVVALALDCGNGASRGESPTAYRWPERFAYRVDYAALAQRDTIPLVRYDEERTTLFSIRDQRYLVTWDSVLKTVQRPGGAAVSAPLTTEDTLSFYVKLGRHGEVSRVELGCDPALAACAAALPSSFALQLRRIVPALPQWEAPRGSSWQDTLAFDDASRPLGAQGTLVTVYRAAQDTVIAGVGYWMIGWRSERRAFRAGPPSNPIVAEQPVREDGVTFVEKQRLMPVYSTWAGATPASAEVRALGATAAGFRGRAWLVGSVFDSILGARR